MITDIPALRQASKHLWLPQGQRSEGVVRLAIRMVGTKYGPFREEVSLRARNTMHGSAPWSEFVSVWIHVYSDSFPKHRFDLDNVAKAALDGLCGAVIRDDHQVVNLMMRKRRASTSLTIITIRKVKHIQ